MPDRGSSASGAIPPSFFRLGSSLRWWRPPPNRGRADQLLQAAFNRERLQVRESLLEGQPLLVEVLAGPPQLQSDLPRAHSFVRMRVGFCGDNLHDLVEPARVVRGERTHA